ncbi:flagellar basal body-associated FliL family protein [Opitutus sp. ER46]|uniref:flagellar basal body-associated FliL family protein n=1 Tax=Opitutus sp. ER46 TaxID=2161864 RepID=UPI000D31F97F|nr:flagellar basal body-associated FliL family protein [Opitutus sp. ER46]PTX90905.1 flagellar basal body protein FliL [Opitutus sp. ER46]
MPPPPKSDASATPPPAAAKPEKAPPPAAEAAAPAAPAAAAGGGIKAWIPAIVSIVIAPALTWVTAEYVLVPRLQKKLALPPPTVEAPAAEAGEAEGGKHGKPKEASTYEFTNVVVNLAGTMGTRYLKTSFHVVGDAKGTVDIKKVFEENRTKLYDTTLNVLSSLTLADLEEAGAKNVIREKLVSAYNQAMGKRVAEQVYFSDFVVQ